MLVECGWYLIHILQSSLCIVLYVHECKTRWKCKLNHTYHHQTHHVSRPESREHVHYWYGVLKSKVCISFCNCHFPCKLSTWLYKFKMGKVQSFPSSYPLSMAFHGENTNPKMSYYISSSHFNRQRKQTCLQLSAQ